MTHGGLTLRPFVLNCMSGMMAVKMIATKVHFSCQFTHAFGCCCMTHQKGLCMVGK